MRGVCPICGTGWKTRRRRKTPFCEGCSRRISANRTNMKKFGRGCTHYWILDNHNFGYCYKCGEARCFKPKPSDSRFAHDDEERCSNLTQEGVP